ncbi:glycosyltransferase family 4 protein [Haloarchaeobius sp. HRN-SO-5]|uniref:glycosyltransferase family 4 protein n=1 Tax=Haloarchaeobius sp. HRN-SO-5 TaxID=3446118 RepID=UPI003EC0C3D4
MRIGIVTPRYPPTHAGGGEISVQLLAEQLQRRDSVETVEVLSFDGETAESVGGVSVSRLTDVPQYPYTLPNEIAYRALRSLDLEYDVLHAYNMHLHPAVGRISARFDIPSVATLNAYPLLDWEDVNVRPSLKRRVYEKTLLRFERPRLKRMMDSIDLFLPLSHDVEEIYRNQGFEGHDYTVVPNMIDPSFDVPSLSSEDSDGGTLLYVGYLRDSKGVRHLIDAMAHLPTDLELKIVGDGPRRDELEQRAAASGRADQITFTGRVPYEEVTRSYATADVFVHPGVWPEPFGRTILEAMQAGLPVVATNIGGPSETVPQQELLCSPGDPVSLSDSIRRAYEDRTEIGAQNRDHVQRAYHPDTVVPRFMDAYRRVVHG